MFNLGNILKAVVTVAAIANAIIRQVAKSNPVVASWSRGSITFQFVLPAVVAKAVVPAD